VVLDLRQHCLKDHFAKPINSLILEQQNQYLVLNPKVIRIPQQLLRRVPIAFGSSNMSTFTELPYPNCINAFSYVVTDQIAKVPQFFFTSANT
jgi:hypothetical protein